MDIHKVEQESTGATTEIIYVIDEKNLSDWL